MSICFFVFRLPFVVWLLTEIRGDPYFLDFINLPPRSYKDYFAVITSPLSLKGLQKLVKGIHGRQPATGVSDFKSWAAFEEKASLLWTNAHFYNEEGSVIHTLATELKVCMTGSTYVRLMDAAELTS